MNSNNFKPINSPKEKVKFNTYKNCSMTNGNTNTHIITQSNGTQPNKRNDKRRRYCPSPRRFLSLTKDLSQKNSKKNSKSNHLNKNNAPNINTNRKKYPVYSTIKESNLKSYQYGNNNAKYSPSKSNSLTQQCRQHNANYLSYSHNKNQEQNTFTFTTQTNNYNNKNDCNNYFSPKTTHNSFLSKVFSQLTNSSSENFNIQYKNQSKDIDINDKKNKDKNNKIKVNRKHSAKTQQAIINNNFLTNASFIRKYSNYLTQREINELQTFPYRIYFTEPFDKRQTDNIKYSNELTSTFSYSNFPNYTYVPLPRSNSYKSFNEIYLQPDNEYYNDEEANLNLIQGDHLLYRYEIIQLLGSGSFGEAVRCLDHKTNQIVCVKIIKANPKFYIQARMEIEILKEISKVDVDNESNVVKLLSHFIFRSHICLVFELLDINLYEYIKLNDYRGISLEQVKTYATQLLFTLLFLKKSKILHCDLKPENILLAKGDYNSIKVIDFGSSCYERRKIYTYIQSRFYRSPEIILDMGYSFEIDIWSLGCILPELYCGFPLFPGEEEREQLMYIMEYIGVPPVEMVEMSNKKYKCFNERNEEYPYYNAEGGLRMPNSKTISDFIKGNGNGGDEDILFIDFIERCLRWMPIDRITPEEALMHDWIIYEMNAEELCMHKRKIRRLKLGINKVNQIKEVPISERSGIRSKGKETQQLQQQQSKQERRHFRTNANSKGKANQKSIKTHKNNTNNYNHKQAPFCLYGITTKKSISNTAKIDLVLETITNIKKQREFSSKKKYKPDTE